ncbi:MAG: hypothetical protein OEV08_09705 [Nitrospira sp.]|nr:hypothetical protein [Nitrospira sp.]
MSADALVASALKEVQNSVAAGVVDLATGMLLAVKTTESHPQSVLDLLAGASKEMFEGDMVQQIEKIFKKTRGETGDDHYFKEIIVTSKNLLHVFCRLKAKESVVLVVVCRVNANLGLTVNKTRELAAGATL